MPPSRPSASATFCKALRSRSSLLPSAKAAQSATVMIARLSWSFMGHARREDCRREELVGTPRFELGTPCTPCKCATRLRHVPPEKPVLTPANGVVRGGRIIPKPAPLPEINVDAGDDPDDHAGVEDLPEPIGLAVFRVLSAGYR